jgi:hypothetical protein
MHAAMPMARPKNINDGKSFVFPYAAPGGFKIVFKHKSQSKFTG